MRASQTLFTNSQAKQEPLSLEDKISFYHLALFLVALPFDLFYSQVILISLIFHVLIHFKREKIKSIFTWQNLLLSSVLLFNIIALTWSIDKERGIREIGRQSAIILFPLVFSAINLNVRLYWKKLPIIFGVTCTITIVYLFADAIRTILYHKMSFTTLFSQLFINHNFSEPIGIHATYLSMYIALSIATFLYSLLQEKNKLMRILYFGAIAILLAGLLQLASRSVLLSTIFFIVFVFPFFLPTAFPRLRFIIATVIISGITLFGITRIDSFKRRFVVEFRNDLNQNAINNEILEPRIIRWKAAVPLFKEAPLFGHGTGAELSLLKEKYFENNLFNSYLNELNAHNQYLSFLINAGVCGLLIFLFTLAAGFINAWKDKNVIFFSFLILISVVSFSENILLLNKGVFFYAFFFSFFLKSKKLSVDDHKML